MVKISKGNIGIVSCISIWLFMALPSLHAQESAAPVQPRVDFFAGAELHYRDLFYGDVYELLVNLTPGVKWNMGR